MFDSDGDDILATIVLVLGDKQIALSIDTMFGIISKKLFDDSTFNISFVSLFDEDILYENNW